MQINDILFYVDINAIMESCFVFIEVGIFNEWIKHSQFDADVNAECIS